MTYLLRSMVAMAIGAAVAMAVPVVRKAALFKRPEFAAFNGGVMPKTAPILAGDWSVRVAFPNLTFQNPLGLCPVPGTNDLLVWEREGKVWRFANDPNTAQKTLVADVSAMC